MYLFILKLFQMTEKREGKEWGNTEWLAIFSKAKKIATDLATSIWSANVPKVLAVYLNKVLTPILESWKIDDLIVSVNQKLEESKGKEKLVSILESLKSALLKLKWELEQLESMTDNLTINDWLEFIDTKISILTRKNNLEFTESIVLFFWKSRRSKLSEMVSEVSESFSVNLKSALSSLKDTLSEIKLKKPEFIKGVIENTLSGLSVDESIIYLDRLIASLGKSGYDKEFRAYLVSKKEESYKIKVIEMIDSWKLEDALSIARKRAAWAWFKWDKELLEYWNQQIAILESRLK